MAYPNHYKRVVYVASVWSSKWSYRPGKDATRKSGAMRRPLVIGHKYLPSPNRLAYLYRAMSGKYRKHKEVMRLWAAHRALRRIGNLLVALLSFAP